MHKGIRVSLVAVAVISAVFAAGFAVAATVSPSFVNSGTTRYAMVSAEDAITTQSTSFVDVPGLSSVVHIPSGKVADLIIDFSGEINTCDGTLGRATIDGAAASPSSTQLMWNLNGGAESHAFTFYARGVGSGSHTVTIQWAGVSSCNHQFMSARSMIITANIH